MLYSVKKQQEEKDLNEKKIKKIEHSIEKKLDQLFEINISIQQIFIQFKKIDIAKLETKLMNEKNKKSDFIEKEKKKYFIKKDKKEE